MKDINHTQVSAILASAPWIALVQLSLMTRKSYNYAGLDPSRASTGVVWCTERAYEYGLLEDPSKWANLGQGAPEVDDGMVNNSRVI